MTGESTTGVLERQDTARARYSVDETVAIMRRVLIENYGIDDPNLSAEAEISALGLDSLSFVEYAFELEAALRVEFDDLPRDLTTIGDFIRFVHGEVLRQNGDLTR